MGRFDLEQGLAGSWIAYGTSGTLHYQSAIASDYRKGRLAEKKGTRRVVLVSLWSMGEEQPS